MSIEGRKPDKAARAASLTEALRHFLVEITDAEGRLRWFGRERDAISLFAFGALREQLLRDGIISDPRQIAIESAAVQTADPIPGKQRKAVVCKDLVIWGAPGQTVWSATGVPSNQPLAIVEWKFQGSRLKRDLDDEELSQDERWLAGFTKRFADTLGVALDVDLREQATLTFRFLGLVEQTGPVQLKSPCKGHIEGLKQ